MTREEIIEHLRQMAMCMYRGECDGCPHEDSNCIGLDGMASDKARAAKVLKAAANLLANVSDTKCEELRCVITDLTAQLADKDDTIDVQRKQLIDVNGVCNDLRTELADSRAECAQLKKQLRECSAVPQVPAADVINHPPHYTYGERECIDEMEILFGREAVIAYCRCAAYKYKYRAGHKDDAAQDYAKADWYIDKAAELLAKPNLKGS